MMASSNPARSRFRALIRRPEAQIDLADNPFAPKGAPAMAMSTWGELRAYVGVPKQGPLPEEMQRKLIHGYYAATSYTDAQIGRVLKALDDEGLRDNTIVIAWGDHGWHLGDHGLWCKHTNFEQATHVPMLMRVPGKKAGVKVTGLTEFVDIYPTLCELAGLPLPAHLEGTSFAPLLDDPGRKWKQAAFSQYPRPGHMGYTLRTGRYRYTEWRKNGTGQADGVELYDYEKDPEENVNLAAEKGHEELLLEMAKLMKAGWRGARP
jgi:arylsulfatase A-like enzyme